MDANHDVAETSWDFNWNLWLGRMPMPLLACFPVGCLLVYEELVHNWALVFFWNRSVFGLFSISNYKLLWHFQRSDQILLFSQLIWFLFSYLLPWTLCLSICLVCCLWEFFFFLENRFIWVSTVNEQTNLNMSAGKEERESRKLTWLMPGNVPGSIRNINAYIQ